MMKRLFFLLTALLTLSVGMRAQTQSVTYIDENGVEQTVTATVITNLTTTLNAGWYVVSTNVQTGYLTCNGEVHLILADGAILQAMGEYFQAGIQVSGEGNSLSIYGQAAQSGILFAAGGKSAAGIGGGLHNSGSGSNITINGGRVTATGGESAAGIGGGERGSGSDITIYGGRVTATGGNLAAGIGGGYGGSGSNITINGGRVTATGGISAAGIGGGYHGSGSNITINGGTVSANGGNYGGAGIGGGESGSGSNITVDITLVLKADNNNPPTTLIENNGNDLASMLSGKQYATIVNLISYKKAATDAIDAAIVDVTDEDVLAIATTAKTNINSATTTEAIDSIKTQALSDILATAKEKAVAAIDAKIEGVTDTDILAIAEAAKTSISSATTAGDVEPIKNTALADLEYPVKYYNSGKAAVLGSMGEPCTDCPAVVVTKSGKSVKLYQPDKVEFIMESEAK